MRKNNPLDYSILYAPEKDFDRVYTRATGKRIAAFLKKGQKVLELGSATSLMTEQLASKGAIIDCVERWQKYITIAKKKKLRAVTYHQGDIEDYETKVRYDHIVMTNVLQELAEPEAVLKRISAWLKPDGKLHITVPNPESIHRKAALYAGMIKDLTTLGARGTKYHVMKLYYNDEVEKMAKRAGLISIHQDGVMFKPLPNDEMAKMTPEVLAAFDRLASDFPDHSALTYFVFTRRKR